MEDFRHALKRPGRRARAVEEGGDGDDLGAPAGEPDEGGRRQAARVAERAPEILPRRRREAGGRKRRGDGERRAGGDDDAEPGGGAGERQRSRPRAVGQGAGGEAAMPGPRAAKGGGERVAGPGRRADQRSPLAARPMTAIPMPTAPPVSPKPAAISRRPSQPSSAA